MRVFESIAAERGARKMFGGDQSSLFQAHGSDGLLSRKFQVKESFAVRKVLRGGRARLEWRGKPCGEENLAWTGPRGQARVEVGREERQLSIME